MGDVTAEEAAAGAPAPPAEDVLYVLGRPVAVAELPPPPTLRTVAGRAGWRGATDALVPIGLFLLLNTTVGIVPAMIGASAWSLAMIVFHRRGGRQVGWMLWASCAFVVARGAAGAITGSKYVYFGPGILNNALIGLAFLASAVVRRPLVASIAQLIYPFSDAVRAHRRYRSVMVRLTVMWGLYELINAGMQSWLLATQSANTLVWARAVVGWPVLVGLFAFSLRYPRRALARDPELRPVVEAVEDRGRRA